ncbi:MAG: FG-GAP-like repeat-containing protein [Phycisphaerales bacterium JB040]
MTRLSVTVFLVGLALIRCVSEAQVCEPSFELPNLTHVEFTEKSVALADFNGDGREDALLAELGPMIRVYFAGESGAYDGGVVSIDTGLLQSQMAIPADMNSDGHLDVLGMASVGYQVSDPRQLQYFPGDGAGGFGPGVLLPTTQFFTLGTVARVGDFDGNGRTDVVFRTGSYNQKYYRVVFQNTDGTFDQPVSLPAPGVAPPRVADFNEDGLDDIVYEHDRDMSIVFGRADRVLTDRLDLGPILPPTNVQPPYGPAYFGDPWIGDFNADGHADLFLSRPDTFGPMKRVVLLGDGAGSMVLGDKGFIPTGSVISGLADIDRDGADELIATYFGDSYLVEFDGDEIVSSAWYYTEGHTSMIALTEIGNGPGPEVFLAFTDPAGILAAELMSDHLPALPERNVYGAGHQLDRAVRIDADADGYSELFAEAGYNNLFHVRRGTQGGGFERATQTFLTDERGELTTWTVGEFTGDGVPDVALSMIPCDGCEPEEAPHELMVHPGGVGAEGYSVSDSQIRSGDSGVDSHAFVSMAPLDLDGDGVDDLVATRYLTGDGPYLLRNDGTGVFTQTTLPPPDGALNPFLIGAFDATGDALPDLVVNAGSSIYVYRGTHGPGGLAFQPPDSPAAPGFFTTLTGVSYPRTADLNGDGRTDFAVAGSSAGLAELRVWTNNSDGTFTLTVHPTQSPSPSGVTPTLALGDLNHDSHLDAVVVGDVSLTLLSGDGSGGFVAGTPQSVFKSCSNCDPFTVLITDVNGDGWNELLSEDIFELVVWRDTCLPDPCPADVNADGVLDNADIGAFVRLYLGADTGADFNGDGVIDSADIGAFVSVFLAGC